MRVADTPVTDLLAAASRGESGAVDQLLPLLYQELRALARGRLARERGDHTLTPTALVHEAYLRLVGGSLPALRDRNHFLAIAAIAMRRVLVDHARGLARDKRGGGLARVSLGEGMGAAEPPQLLELDLALTRLARLDPDMARVVELRWFGGLEVEEVASVLELSPRTIARRWTQARAWLSRELAA